jgi:catechol 2,3-dioxygenase-like lactoylglutathione lyase family enzyme
MVIACENSNATNLRVLPDLWIRLSIHVWLPIVSISLRTQVRVLLTLGYTTPFKTMLFTEVAFTCYPVTDLPASRAFYEGVLGLSPAMVEPMGDDGGWVEYELGPHTLAIGKAPGWLPSPDGPSCGLEAVDFDATITALKNARASFKIEPFETPICRMAMVLDPSGNVIIIHKRKPGHQ